MAGVSITPDSNMVIVGKVGSGKSQWTQRVLIPALRRIRKQRIIILDAKNEYRKLSGATVVKSPQILNQMLYNQKPEKIPKLIRIPIVNPTMEGAENFLRAAWSPVGDEANADVIYQPTYPIRVIIEDAPIYYSERGGRDPDWLKRWFVLGRAGNRVCTVTMQRTQLCPKIILSQSETIVAFKMSDYDAENYIRRYHGDAPTNIVKSMKRYEYVIMSDYLDYPLHFDPISGKFPARPKGVELGP